MERADELAAARPRVLVVDDEPYNCELLKRILRGCAEVASAATVAEALAVAATARFDAVITDHRLVGGDGLALAIDLKAAHPTLRIALVTGWLGDPAIEAGRRAGAVEVVFGKPFVPASLREWVVGGG